MAQDNSGGALRRAKVSRQFQRMALELLDRNSAAAKAVFLGEDGQITKQGERLLAAMAREARINQHGFGGDADRRLFDAGAQHMVRWLTDALDVDGRKLEQLRQNLND